MIKKNTLIFYSILIFFCGCTVRPLYEQAPIFGESTDSSLSNIDVDVIAERDGQKLRSYLIGMLRDIRFAKQHCRLTVTLSSHEKQFALSIDGNAKRVLCIYDAHVILRDDEGKILLNDKVSASTSYNISHAHGEVTLSLYGRHNDHLIKELGYRIIEILRMVIQ